ncbi:MAG TPA: hypothetical protein VK025_16275 [Steroidobacter sp.]|nr:hypothetical protein [Steroidobacter sp.]
MRLPITTPCLLLLLGAAPAVAGPAGGAIDAIWRSQELRLVYFSSTMHYSCGALQEKIAAVLMAVGAAAPVVQIPSCSLDGRLMSSAIVRIWLRSPAPATSENIHAAATFNATEKLIARVRNERLPTEADIERFPASWRSVSLYNHPGLPIDQDDCELMRAITEQVFPELNVRVTRRAKSCPSGGRLRPTLKVEALVSAPEREIGR